MLGLPGGDSRVGTQKRQVGEVSSAVISPPLCGEAQQNFDDIAESDVASGTVRIVASALKIAPP